MIHVDERLLVFGGIFVTHSNFTGKIIGNLSARIFVVRKIDQLNREGVVVTFYAKRNLMNEIIRPEDIANAVFALTALLDKSTGNMINVDGGMSSAFVR